MNLKLLIKEEEKTFHTPFVPGTVFRKFIEYKARMNLNDLKGEELDELASLVVYAFKNQFTLEEFYDGIPQDELMITIDLLFAPTPKKGEGNEGNGKK
jgi:hypothetical protein